MNDFATVTQLTPQVRPLSNAGGAAITGIDLRSSISEKVEEMLRSVWRDYLVLVIRDQNIEEQHQERFCKIFGNLAGLRSKVYRTSGNTKSHALWVANAEDSSRPTAVQQGEMMFHIDQCYTERPSKASTLYAVTIPDEGGNTRFSNLIKAYEGLSDDWKMRIEGLRALNYFDYQANATTRPETIDPNGPQFLHPIVRTHPETGQKSLFVNRQMTMFIEGLGA
ncbi:MAG: TauD/TfdA family dioxygenase, partial [Rhodospirillaceae bacterium]